MSLNCTKGFWRYVWRILTLRMLRTKKRLSGFVGRTVQHARISLQTPSLLYNMFFLHARVPSLSISGTSTGPRTSSSSNASTTASPTRSAFRGFIPPAPINHVNRPPTALLIMLATPPAAAMGSVKVRLLSYMKGARMKIDRIVGNVVEIRDSASRFVVM